ncbi:MULTISPECIES: SigE family RNA polymerase sigma factor [Streptomyces]|uniref:RNA polymerase sigma factor n=1 Tax=Streptomyces venezuelae TaxID=54571 RepID=A0A5P2B9D8_STRVZ|nr:MULTISPECIES: SigE family RNA polymerase sigma factor [Streptomyces]MYY83972.1 SigE family RNA polymerase sigma factor [Streptomyces sp. SID335]MYZ14644.1 SigE family RNA polymerase sigma factor [Streptomyces sp. SID337]NEB45187.1 SigE family RNA polymerase sigma factor [Streptomyces sp. SID339]QES26530.1 SigE family RNA polymerase sigma factor [Streptomyces venezuelae]
MTEDEFDAFYAAAFPRLVGQLYALTGDHGEAQDVVQEAFVRAWDRRRSFLADEAPEAWIRTVAMRLAVSRWRRARRWVDLVRRNPPADRVPGPGPERTALVQALRTLPEAQRTAVVLHHLCDLSVEQVASETGSPVGTVKARLSRGRAALAAQLSAGPDAIGARDDDGDGRSAKESGRVR